MSILRKIISLIIRIAASVVLIALIAVLITSVSPVYRFKAPEPFSGPDIYNPYSSLDTCARWMRANFHTHTRVEGIFNECEFWPGEVYEEYMKYGYDIVTFSNHNELTVHPFDPDLQVNVYEHGYNLFKYHKLVFGSEKVNRFDHLLPIFPFQRQFQIEMLRKDSDMIQINHPLRTSGSSREMMEKLSGYEIMELDSGKSTENEYWDWALSAGHYCTGLANDDLHFPDRSRCIAVRCNYLSCNSAGYEDIRSALLEGCSYSMRVPDYGNGDWEIKKEGNRMLPFIEDIGLDRDSIYISLSHKADSIRITGQDHRTLLMTTGSGQAGYRFKADDSYARFTAFFPGGEVIYSNPFARYDKSLAERPSSESTAKASIILTILYNLMLSLLTAGAFAALIKINIRHENKSK